MDISKLPRLSKTDAPPPPDPAALGPVPEGPGAFEVITSTSATTSGYCACGAPLRPDSNFCDSCGARVSGSGPARALPYRPVDIGTGAEVWISVAVGALLLLMQPRLIQFVFHKLFGTSFAPYIDAQTGAEVPYTAQMDFWSDLGITLFAFVLIVEGLAIAFARKRGVLMLAFGLTVLTTAYNLAYLVLTFSSGIAILSAFAVAFGVYIALFQWRLLQASRGGAFAGG